MGKQLSIHPLNYYCTRIIGKQDLSKSFNYYYKHNFTLPPETKYGANLRYFAFEHKIQAQF